MKVIRCAYPPVTAIFALMWFAAPIGLACEDQDPFAEVSTPATIVVPSSDDPLAEYTPVKPKDESNEEPFSATSEESDDDPFGGGNEPRTKEPPRAPKRPRMLSTDDEIRTVLNRKVDLLYDEAELLEVIHSLQQEHKFNIQISPNLEGELDLETLITTDLRDLPMRDSLRNFLEYHNATYVVHRGMLEIICVEDRHSRDYLVCKIFPVGDLVAAIEASRKTDGDQTLIDAREELAATIRRATNPSIWMTEGEDGESTLSFVGNAMVVTSDEETLERVQWLLEQLQDASGAE